MNFQSVKSAPGQYIQLQAVITEITHQTGQYGPYALGKAQDNQGVIEQVLFTVKKDAQFPAGLAAGHSCNWAGKYDANTGNMKLFFGNMAQRDVAAQAPVQTPPQAAPAPPQQANAPIHVPVGQDATRLSIERQCASKVVGRWVEQEVIPPEMAVKWCCIIHKWIETGQDIPVSQDFGGQPYDDQGPPIDDENIPF